jgi:methionyl-tRNA formyltransferase
VVESLGPFDLGVLVAFGQLIRPETLAIPRAGILNAHFSLLPRWRGAAPVERSIMAGDTRTGVSVMRLDPGLDTGPVIAMASSAIGDAETGGSLTERLAIVAAREIARTVEPFAGGLLLAVPQPPEGATYADKLTASDRRVDWTRPATEIARRVRALNPRPGVSMDVDDGPVKILTAVAREGSMSPGAVETDGGRLLIGTGAGILEPGVVQPAGKGAMEAPAWLRGLRTAPSAIS